MNLKLHCLSTIGNAYNYVLNIVMKESQIQQISLQA